MTTEVTQHITHFIRLTPHEPKRLLYTFIVHYYKFPDATPPLIGAIDKYQNKDQPSPPQHRKVVALLITSLISGAFLGFVKRDEGNKQVT